MSEGTTNEGTGLASLADLDTAELAELRKYKADSEAAKSPAPPATAEPAAPAPVGKGDLVLFGAGTHDQLGLTLHDPDHDGRVTVAWFAGRSGLIPADQLERFDPEPTG